MDSVAMVFYGLLRALYYLAAISLPQIIRALKDGQEYMNQTSASKVNKKTGER